MTVLTIQMYVFGERTRAFMSQHNPIKAIRK